MPPDWNQVWLFIQEPLKLIITGAIGASIIKLLDLLVDRYRKGQSLREKMVDRLLEYLDELGEVTQLYSLFGRYSAKVVTDDSGKLLKDESGNWMREVKVFEPDSDLAEAFIALNETDIRGFINQKIITINQKIRGCLDSASELDKSGELRERLNDLYTRTTEPGRILKNKDVIKPEDAIIVMVNALKNADNFRRELRKEVSRYRK